MYHVETDLKYHVKTADANSMVYVSSSSETIRDKKELNSDNDCVNWVNAHDVPTRSEDKMHHVADSAFVLQWRQRNQEKTTPTIIESHY